MSREPDPVLRGGEEASDPAPHDDDLTRDKGFTGDYPDPPAPEDTGVDTPNREGT